LLAATFDLCTVIELGARYLSHRESEGVFQYGNYRKEADDLRSVVSYFAEQKYAIIALVGHSKGR
jgi:solute carrier family 25 (adenine nucleotide translocator) protein 4/5/6/31